MSSANGWVILLENTLQQKSSHYSKMGATRLWAPSNQSMVVIAGSGVMTYSLRFFKRQHALQHRRMDVFL